MYDNFEEKYKVPIKVHPLLADVFYSRFLFCVECVHVYFRSFLSKFKAWLYALFLIGSIAENLSSDLKKTSKTSVRGDIKKFYVKKYCILL